MNLPQLPEKPVNGFEVCLWSLKPYDHTPTQTRYVYHVNTAWSDWSDAGSLGGRDIIDEWLIYENSHRQNSNCTGRIAGWSSLSQLSDGIFTTRREAMQDAINWQEMEIAYLREKMADANQKLAHLREDMESSQ